MKKFLVSIVLGIALLGTNGAATAEQSRPAEPRWGIRPERSSAPSALDLARWLARRLNETVGIPVPVPLVPVPNPAPTPKPLPTPNDGGDEVCDPERGHCPVG